MTKEQYRQIIREGFEVMMNPLGRAYTKVVIVQKLQYLGHGVSRSYLTKLDKEERVKPNFLKRVAEGFLKILESEEGLVYNEVNSKFEKTSDPDWKEYNIPTEIDTEEEKKTRNGFTFYEEGRLLPGEKVDFMKSAQDEVIEVGIRLRAFLEYMTRAADRNFKRPMEELLERGIDVKCYILDPDAQVVRMYFDDLAKEISKEKESEAVIREVIKGLVALSREFEEVGLPGKLEIYTYAHVPQAHYFVVDRNRPGGKMMVSHYIYGLPRGKCPVIAFTQKDKPQLFKKYKEGLEILMKGAKKIFPLTE